MCVCVYMHGCVHASVRGILTLLPLSRDREIQGDTTGFFLDEFADVHNQPEHLKELKSCFYFFSANDKILGFRTGFSQLSYRNLKMILACSKPHAIA